MAEDRRTGLDRRRKTTGELELDLRRHKERRMGDRRESPRIPVTLLVRYDELGGSFEERQGDIAIGGVYFLERFAPPGRGVQLRFHFPGREGDVRVQGEIVRVSEHGNDFGVHIRFLDLDTRTELAIARFIDDRSHPEG
jgi:hypothetical protein